MDDPINNIRGHFFNDSFPSCFDRDDSLVGRILPVHFPLVLNAIALAQLFAVCSQDVVHVMRRHSHKKHLVVSFSPSEDLRKTLGKNVNRNSERIVRPPRRTVGLASETEKQIETPYGRIRRRRIAACCRVFKDCPQTTGVLCLAKRIGPFSGVFPVAQLEATILKYKMFCLTPSAFYPIIYCLNSGFNIPVSRLSSSRILPCAVSN
jgi:hypothetical protein